MDGGTLLFFGVLTILCLLLVCAVTVLSRRVSQLKCDLAYAESRIEKAVGRSWDAIADVDSLAAAAGFKRAGRIVQPTWERKL